jgi:hypothetical protein
MPTRYEQERMIDESIARMLEAQEHELSLRDLEPKDSYCDSRNITGVPSNANRTYHVAQSSWDVHHDIRPDGTLRAVGRVRAVGSDVKVTRPDGTVEIRSAASFRSQREQGSSTTVVQQNEQQARRIALLARVGNASDYNN